MKSFLAVVLSVALLWGCGDEGPSGPARPDPVVAAVRPAQVEPGDTLTVTGSNFGSRASDVAITIGGVRASILSITPSQILAIVPPVQPGAATLRITLSGASNAATANLTILPTVPPEITGVDPDPAQGGATLRISGRDFGTTLADVVVKVDETPVQLLEVGDTSIQVQVPAELNGNFSLTVTVRGRMSASRILSVVSSGSSQNGTIVGRAVNAATAAGLGGVQITTNPATATLLTDAEGNFRIENLAPDLYTVIANQEGFQAATASVLVAPQQTVSVTLRLGAAPTTATILGLVTNAATGSGIEGARVTLNVIGDTIPVIGDTIPIDSTASRDIGSYSLSDVRPGSYLLIVQAAGFTPASLEVTVSAGQVLAANVSLSADMGSTSLSAPAVASRSPRGIGSVARGGVAQRLDSTADPPLAVPERPPRALQAAARAGPPGRLHA